MQGPQEPKGVNTQKCPPPPPAAPGTMKPINPGVIKADKK